MTAPSRTDASQTATNAGPLANAMCTALPGRTPEAARRDATASRARSKAP